MIIALTAKLKRQQKAMAVICAVVKGGMLCWAHVEAKLERRQELRCQEAYLAEFAL